MTEYDERHAEVNNGVKAMRSKCDELTGGTLMIDDPRACLMKVEVCWFH